VATIAAPIPLTSLSDDVRALDRALERTHGPVILAAHAYAGAVIGSTVNDRVRGLVFVSALAPDEGETVADVFYREPPHPQAPQLAPDTHGFIWMPDSGFPSAFAHHASRQQNTLFAAVQRPINVACIQEKAPKPLWKTVPSWYLLAEQDRMIHPKTQEFMASRMKAGIQHMDVDHTPIATAPDKVVGLLQTALRVVSR
jgi:pimeloyl-ACP methyl ester carboxylesterase